MFKKYLCGLVVFVLLAGAFAMPSAEASRYYGEVIGSNETWFDDSRHDRNLTERTIESFEDLDGNVLEPGYERVYPVYSEADRRAAEAMRMAMKNAHMRAFFNHEGDLVYENTRGHYYQVKVDVYRNNGGYSAMVVIVPW